MLTNLATNNWLGLPSLSIALGPFTLLCGPNGAGKTALLDAIHFALFATMPRGVGRKADLDQLLTSGSDSGFVELTIEGRQVKRSIKTAQLGKVAVPPLHHMASLVLTAGAFTAMDEGERRKVLSELLQVTTTPDTIAERLKKAGLPEAVVMDLRPFIARGFEAAEKQATVRAIEARGAWKALTGETYGAAKAVDWAPEAVKDAPSDVEVDETSAVLAQIQAEINGLNQAIGAASRGLSPEARAELKKQADRLPALLESETRGQAAYTTHQNRIIELGPISLGNAGTTTPCPHCNEAVVIDGGHLRKPADAPTADMVAAHTELTGAKASLAEVNTKLTTLRQTIAQCQNAAARLESEPDAGPAPAELRVQLEEKQSREASLRSLLAIQTGKRADAKRADGAALRAAIEHQAVLDFVKAAEMLGPNGIPAVLVAAVLEPVNAILREVAEQAGFEPVRLDAGMRLHYGEIPYPLASRSQRWRMDAAMGFTLARLIGLHVVLLDELDVLDLPSRANVLRWLHGLSGKGWQVVAGATLKEPPSIAGVTTVWLDAETTGRLAA